MKPEIISYHQGKYSFNPELLTEEEQNLDIKLTPIIRLKKDSGPFGFQMTFKYTIEKQIVLDFGFVVSMRVADWIPLTSNDVVDKSSTENENKSIREILFSRAPGQINRVSREMIDFARGALAARLEDTRKYPLGFPEINLDEFINAINFRLVE